MERVNKVINRNIKEFGKHKKIRIVSAIDKNYLEETYKNMAMKGWLVNTVKGVRDSYLPIEPCELEFSVTHFQPVTPLDYPDYDKEDTYQEFCEDSGWTLAAKNERFFVYYKAVDSEVLPIHTEPSEEYRSIWNAMKKSELISFPILMLLMIFQLWMGINNFRYENLYQSAGMLNVIYPSLFLIVIGAYMIPFVSWLIKNRARAKESKPLLYDSYNKVRIRNGLYNGGLALILIYLTFNIINMFSLYFSIGLFLICILNIVFPLGFGLLLRIKIKKIKSKRSTNVIILLVGFFIIWAMMIATTFMLIGQMDYERINGNLPPDIPILNHRDLGANLELQPRYIDMYQTLMVPLSFEYESYHRDYQGDFYDIELTYIQARTKWLAEIIANRVIYDELQDIEKDREWLFLDGLPTDYVYSLNSDAYRLDMAYNLSRFNSRVMLVKDNIIYIIKLDTSIDEEVLENIIAVLFEKNE